MENAIKLRLTYIIVPLLFTTSNGGLPLTDKRKVCICIICYFFKLVLYVNVKNHYDTAHRHIVHSQIAPINVIKANISLQRAAEKKRTPEAFSPFSQQTFGILI